MLRIQTIDQGPRGATLPLMVSSYPFFRVRPDTFWPDTGYTTISNIRPDNRTEIHLFIVIVTLASEILYEISNYVLKRFIHTKKLSLNIYKKYVLLKPC